MQRQPTTDARPLAYNNQKACLPMWNPRGGAHYVMLDSHILPQPQRAPPPLPGLPVWPPQAQKHLSFSHYCRYNIARSCMCQLAAACNIVCTKEGAREDDCVEWDVVLRHELVQLHLLCVCVCVCVRVHCMCVCVCVCVCAHACVRV